MIRRKEFSCIRGGLTIRGVEYRCNQDGNLPIVVFSHGFMANQSSVQQYAKKMAELGYAAFTFDFCGGCLGGKSDGKSTDMSVLTEVEDLKAVIRYAKGLTYTDGSHLILAGCSQGGFVSALVAASSEEIIEKLILFYPAIRITDDAKKGKMAMLQFDPQNIPDKIRKGMVCVGRKYVTDVINMDGIQAIEGYKGPVLILYGTLDKVFDAEYAKKAEEIYGDSCQMLKFDKEGHGFSKKGDLAAFEAMEHFVKGREVVLDISIRMIGRKIEYTGFRKTTAVLTFEGDSSGKFFAGKVQPGAADVQEHKGWKIVRLCADYTLKGKDYAGNECSIHIVNVNMGNGWKPTVSTDSETLSFLNHSDCFALLEPRKEGPHVRIFCDTGMYSLKSE